MDRHVEQTQRAVGGRLQSVARRGRPGWGVQAPQEALPGLSRLVSVIACRPVKAGHLFADLSAAVIDELDGDQAD